MPFRDLNATILHQMEVDHNELTFPFQGLDQRPTGFYVGGNKRSAVTAITGCEDVPELRGACSGLRLTMNS